MHIVVHADEYTAMNPIAKGRRDDLEEEAGINE